VWRSESSAWLGQSRGRDLRVVYGALGRCRGGAGLGHPQIHRSQGLDRLHDEGPVDDGEVSRAFPSPQLRTDHRQHAINAT